MNAVLQALDNEISKVNNEIRQAESRLNELSDKRWEEGRAEQKRLIGLFNKDKFSKLKKINDRLPKGYVVSGFESDTYLNGEMEITISRGQYSFDFIVKGGSISYENKKSNDGVGTNNSKQIINIIDIVLNEE